MRWRPDEWFGSALLTSVLAGVAGVAGSYALAGFTPAFVVAPITGSLTRAMPDAVLKFAIVTLTGLGEQFGIEHLGQQANLLLALVLGTGLLASLVLAALATGDRFDSAATAVSLAGLGVWLAAAVLTGASIPSLGAGVGSAAVVAVAALAAATESSAESGEAVSGGRRALVGSLAGALGVGVLGYVLGSRNSAATQPAVSVNGTNGTGNAGNTSGESDSAKTNSSNGGGSGGPTAGSLLAKAEANSLGVKGLEGLVSGDDFYEVDTANPNPDVNAEEWILSVTGAVENEQTFDYEQLTSMPSELRFMTLRCVSDRLNGNKMDNGLWTGVPMERVLEDANLQGEFVMLRSVDGYYEEFPVKALRTGFLAYGKDGEVLPRQHGYPVRALIPGHWGEINVKWISEIEILDRPAKGFWEKKGWKGTGSVNTVAKLHATNRRDDGHVTVAGHANAGTRGIQKVEVSTNGGDSWNEARLSATLEPNLGGDVWRQWAYTYRPPNDEHEVVVRAIDGIGTIQPKKNSGPYPRGTSGWVSKTINP